VRVVSLYAAVATTSVSLACREIILYESGADGVLTNGRARCFASYPPRSFQSARYRAAAATPPRQPRPRWAQCMEGPSLIRNYHNMGKRKGAYSASASAEEPVAGDPNPTARLVLALLLLLVIIAIAFFVWRRARRNRGPHCARQPKPRALESA
jgi:hypothetical protein